MLSSSWVSLVILLLFSACSCARGSSFEALELSRQPRSLFNATGVFNNATSVALAGGAVLFLGLNAAFALAFLDKKDGGGETGFGNRGRRLVAAIFSP